MGVGNWMPSQRDRELGAEYLYLDKDSFNSWDVDGDPMRDLEESMVVFLPMSFERAWKHRKGDKGGITIAENGLMEIALYDWESYIVVVIYPKETPAFAGRAAKSLANKLFDTLATMYKARVRTSAWTSAEYRSSAVEDKGVTKKRHRVDVEVRLVRLA